MSWLCCAPLSCVLLACAAMLVVADEEAEPKASYESVAIAGTLLGAVSFQMALLYLMNHQDDDMRRYCYEIINSTISIFSAVLFFQTFNDLLETYVLEGMSRPQQVAIDMLHMLFWFAVMQLALAWISGAVGSPPKDTTSSRLNLKVLTVLLAHLTGFASINAWGSVQHLAFFNARPERALALVPMAALGQFALQEFFRRVRHRVALSDDDKEDKYERSWEHETAEVENDVTGLMLSFISAQALRFLIVGRLPSQEGSEPWIVLTGTSMKQVTELYVAALANVLAMVFLFVKFMEKGIGEGRGSRKFERGESLAGSESEGGDEGAMKRALDIAIIFFSMGFAWCTFFSTRMCLARLDCISDPMMLAVVLVLLLSFMAVASIQVLDLIVDADFTDDRADDAVRQIIKAIGTLVGFGWEQCFDQAVESISSVLPCRHLSKFILAFLCVVIVVPAWKWYLLPMAVEKGWRFGFVIRHDDEAKWKQVLDTLRIEKKKSARTRFKTLDTLSLDEITGLMAINHLDAPNVASLCEAIKSRKSVADSSAEAVAHEPSQLSSMDDEGIPSCPYISLAGSGGSRVTELTMQNEYLSMRNEYLERRLGAVVRELHEIHTLATGMWKSDPTRLKR